MDNIKSEYAQELERARAGIVGIEFRTAEHPADRAQRHRLEGMAVGLIAATSAFAALLIVFSLFRPVPEKRIDWSAGILQLVLGGALGFALKRSP